MTGLRDTLSHLSHVRRHVDALKAAGQRPADTTLIPISDFGPNPGNLTMLTHVPDGLPADAPLVVCLHGCSQTAAAYDFGSGWSTLADRHGFAVLFPEQRSANNANTCFNWFQPADTQRDQGEVQSIRSMIEHLVVAQGIDRKRIFVVGLSAGGAMTGALLAAYPDVFAAGAIVAGLPVGAATSMQGAFEAMSKGASSTALALETAVRAASAHRGPWPKLSIWHGTADRIVSPVNADQLVQQWLRVHGLTDTPIVTKAGLHTHRAWRDASGVDVIESFTVLSMGHGVPIAPADGIGHVSAYHFDVGVSSSEAMLAFWNLGEARKLAASAATSTNEDGVEDVAAMDVRVFPTANSNGAALRAVLTNKPRPETTPFDPRSIITETLKKAGLVIPEVSGIPADDPRAIISKTLRSVGLLKK